MLEAVMLGILPPLISDFNCRAISNFKECEMKRPVVLFVSSLFAIFLVVGFANAQSSGPSPPVSIGNALTAVSNADLSTVSVAIAQFQIPLSSHLSTTAVEASQGGSAIQAERVLVIREKRIFS